MQNVNLGAVDLNLLVALRALLAERHVTRAARSVGLSQPAMSHALARLRELFDDPLLVRTAAGMQPTPRAESLAPALATALDDLARLVARPGAFEPERSTRRFRIIADDYAELVLLPRVLARVWDEGPKIDVQIRAPAGRGLEDIVEGRADFSIVPARSGPAPRGVYVQKLFHEQFVAVVRADHPHVKKRLSLDDYLALPHALIAPRGQAGSVVDNALAKLGRSRRVAVEIPHFLVAPYLVQKSDLVLLLGARVAAVMAEPLGLRVLAPPRELELQGFGVSLIWHERHRADPAHAWLRRVIADAAKAV